MIFLIVLVVLYVLDFLWATVGFVFCLYIGTRVGETAFIACTVEFLDACVCIRAIFVNVFHEEANGYPIPIEVAKTKTWGLS